MPEVELQRSKKSGLYVPGHVAEEEDREAADEAAGKPHEQPSKQKVLTPVKLNRAQRRKLLKPWTLRKERQQLARRQAARVVKEQAHETDDLGPGPGHH